MQVTQESNSKNDRRMLAHNKYLQFSNRISSGNIDNVVD